LKEALAQLKDGEKKYERVVLKVTLFYMKNKTRLANILIIYLKLKKQNFFTYNL